MPRKPETPPVELPAIPAFLVHGTVEISGSLEWPSPWFQVKVLDKMLVTNGF